MSGVAFDDLRWLNLLWAAAAVCAVGVYGIWQRRRAARAFASAHAWARIAPPVGWARGLVRLTLVGLSLVALVAALIGPRWGEAAQLVARRGIDLIVLLDVSRSMLARDIAPDRLERAKLAIADDLLPALGGDRIGLITFAGAASVKCPLTTDYGFFRLALEEVTTRSAPRGGTLIGDAIRRAVDAFSDDLGNHKVILLITDGEDHDSYPVEAARAAWTEHRIPIVAVGLGDPREGARIPVRTDSGEEYLEHRGQVVWSRAGFDQLRQIAEASDLRAFVPVGTRNFDLGEIYRAHIAPAVALRERQEREEVRQPPRFHLFAAAALLLLAIESCIREAPRPAAAPAAERRRSAA